MRFITGKHIARRTFIRGAGATVALPFLEAMVPAGRVWAKAPAEDGTRLVAIELVHGAAGCNEWGDTQNMWAPEAVGRDFDLSPSALSPLEAYRDYLTIVSNTDAQGAEAVVDVVGLRELRGGLRGRALEAREVAPRLSE